MTAKVQAKADADASKFAAKEERRRSRGGLFGKKKADAGAGPEAQADSEASDSGDSGTS